MTRRRTLAPSLLLAAMLVVVGCGRARAREPEELVVVARTGRIGAPDSTDAGWRRLRVEEDDGGHIVVLFALQPDMLPADVPHLAAALDRSRGTPPMMLALGGPEVGTRGDVVVELRPGRYLLACVRRGDDGHRHAAAGEAHMLVVGPAVGEGAPPRATAELRMVDHAFVGPERWSAGRQVIEVRNEGAQEHQARIARLHPGTTLRGWAEAKDPDAVATNVAGVARLAPGRRAHLPVDLAPGEYVVYCLLEDPASGRAHVALGMFRAVRVE